MSLGKIIIHDINKDYKVWRSFLEDLIDYLDHKKNE